MKPEYQAWLHLVALKFALAGDLESRDALEFLDKRIAGIDWNDPAFIRFSGEMRNDLPTLTAEEEASVQPLLLGALLELSESSAGNREALARHISVFKESLKCSVEKTALIERLFSYLFEVIDVHSQALARIEMLGADTTDFQIPPFKV